MMNVHCDKSPDGRHILEWRTGGEWFFCIYCMQWFEEAETERLLNAALRLTAEEAERVGVEIEQATWDLKGLKAESFLSYAARWRGD